MYKRPKYCFQHVFQDKAYINDIKQDASSPAKAYNPAPPGEVGQQINLILFD
jgi:hypothetical protein